ncbi:hypothetical protein [Robertkochia sediminum]|uniref:hypothetical protein n=1 Tax=Robertkochia sediminum TaxID=2785326 RepID=UPI001931BA72|nr:hypothetical protein [Robertkochia sediminum]MBL7472098.1 hypothetical protein [Robertkochia sediminum]
MKIKTILCLFITFLVSSNTFGQIDKLLGSWQPYAIDNGEFYLNIKTDSIALYEELSYIENDSLKISQLKEIASQLYFNQKHTFKENGKYIQHISMMNLELDYMISASNKLLLVSENQFKDEKDAIEIPFSLKNGVLFLELPVTEPATKLWLKK